MIYFMLILIIKKNIGKIAQYLLYFISDYLTNITTNEAIRFCVQKGYMLAYIQVYWELNININSYS